MEIKLPKKDVAEKDSLPEGDDAVIETKKSDRERELEIELAEQRGELKALKKSAAPANQTLTHEQTKQIVFADINNMPDEAFVQKYKMPKHSASMTIMDQDNRMTKAEAKSLRAEALAVSEIGAEMGSDFYKFKDKILEDAADLSEEARQDPAKLKRWMKSQYLSLAKDVEKPVKKTDDSRRKIVTDFEKPTLEERQQDIELNANDEIKDEIPAESDISNQVLARHMGIRSEKERKQYANAIYVDMDLTGRDPTVTEKIRFRDPKMGFEKVKVA